MSKIEPVEAIRVPLRWRLWFLLCWPFRGADGPATAAEAMLAVEQHGLRAELDESRLRLADLEADKKLLESEKELAALEMKHLLGIAARDRMRVKAEEAEYASKVNQFTDPRRVI